MSWLQIRLFGPYFSSFSTNSYGYYSQTSQNLVSNIQVFASALIVRQAARCFALASACCQTSNSGLLLCCGESPGHPDAVGSGTVRSLDSLRFRV